MHNKRSKRNGNEYSEIKIPRFINSNTSKQEQSYQYGYEDDEGFFKEVSSSVAKQARDEFNIDNTNQKRPRKRKKKYKVLKVVVFALLMLTAICSFLAFTKPGQKLLINLASGYIYDKLDLNASVKKGNSDSTEVLNLNKPITSTKVPNLNKPVINILLIGLEQIYNAQNTDSMMIATIDTKNHTLKLTSLMRDLYVDIPGHPKTRLNAAYGWGGIDLLKQTIEENFGIEVDGYCMVSFDSFEKLIDKVGGVKVTLTQQEAEYLNSTNYISNRKYRNVVEGTQSINGNQALGYCRVRKRATATESNDFGRTQRQRIVLRAIYDKVKKKNIISLAMLMNDILNDKDIPITTDITKTQFQAYLQAAASLKVNEIKTFRLPTDDNYQNAKVYLGKTKQEVLEPKDWNLARQELHDFIYGAQNAQTLSTDTEKQRDTQMLKNNQTQKDTEAQQ
jgi:cell envelope-related function transcriptional attenuator common domain